MKFIILTTLIFNLTNAFANGKSSTEAASKACTNCANEANKSLNKIEPLACPLVNDNDECRELQNSIKQAGGNTAVTCVAKDEYNEPKGFGSSLLSCAAGVWGGSFGDLGQFIYDGLQNSSMHAEERSKKLKECNSGPKSLEIKKAFYAIQNTLSPKLLKIDEPKNLEKMSCEDIEKDIANSIRSKKRGLAIALHSAQLERANDQSKILSAQYLGQRVGHSEIVEYLDYINDSTRPANESTIDVVVRDMLNEIGLKLDCYNPQAAWELKCKMATVTLLLSSGGIAKLAKVIGASRAAKLEALLAAGQNYKVTADAALKALNGTDHLARRQALATLRDLKVPPGAMKSVLSQKGIDAMVEALKKVITSPTNEFERKLAVDALMNFSRVTSNMYVFRAGYSYMEAYENLIKNYDLPDETRKLLLAELNRAHNSHDAYYKFGPKENKKFESSASLREKDRIPFLGKQGRDLPEAERFKAFDVKKHFAGAPVEQQREIYQALVETGQIPEQYRRAYSISVMKDVTYEYQLDNMLSKFGFEQTQIVTDTGTVRTFKNKKTGTTVVFNHSHRDGWVRHLTIEELDRIREVVLANRGQSIDLGITSTNRPPVR